jgi:hypothetical protein
MTSYVTDFGMHAIWQGYVEDLAAKDFVARKACTIALSEAQGSCYKTSNNQPIHEFGYPIDDSIPTRAVLRSLARPRSCKKVSVQGFL